jgi:hypothetical protein
MLPIRIRHFPKFITQVLERTQVLRNPVVAGRTFHLCFFSCHSYFKYLYCSLHSLVSHIDGIEIKILIFNDNEMPLSKAQIDTILALIPDARIIPWPKSMGWGAKQIGSIWRAYKLAAESAADNDIIARVDSDVFFFNDRIFRAIVRSNADLVGDGHYVDFKYSQGGCYFFRASAVRRISTMIEVETIEKLTQELDVIVEDVAAFHFAKQLGLKIWLTWFMMFPDELRNAGGLTAWQRWKFSCIHFVMKNKNAMLESYEREIFEGDASESYKKSIEVN